MCVSESFTTGTFLINDVIRLFDDFVILQNSSFLIWVTDFKIAGFSLDWSFGPLLFDLCVKPKYVYFDSKYRKRYLMHIIKDFDLIKSFPMYKCLNNKFWAWCLEDFFESFSSKSHGFKPDFGRSKKIFSKENRSSQNFSRMSRMELVLKMILFLVSDSSYTLFWCCTKNEQGKRSKTSIMRLSQNYIKNFSIFKNFGQFGAKIFGFFPIFPPKTWDFSQNSP